MNKQHRKKFLTRRWWETNIIFYNNYFCKKNSFVEISGLFWRSCRRNAVRIIAQNMHGSYRIHLEQFWNKLENMQSLNVKVLVCFQFD